MEIVKYPTPSLFERSKEVEINKELLEFIQKMFEFKQNLSWGRAVGLSAPQVGRNIRVFIALDMVYTNPVMEVLEDEGKEMKQEGCYSLEENKFDYKVERYNAIRLTWTNRKGVEKSLIFRGFPAQVIQHEYDHLEGRLCSGDKK